MNRGHVLHSTQVQQMMGGNPNWWSINTNMRPPPPNHSSSNSLLPPPPSTIFPNHYAPPPPPLPSSSWQDNSDENHQQFPDSWSQLLMGGLVGDQEEEMLQLHHHASSNIPTNNNNSELVKQENSSNSSGGTSSFAYGTTSSSSNWSQMMGASNNSPKSSCISSTISNTNILDFSSNKSDSRHPPPDHSSECNSTGGTPKKPRVQPSSSPSTFKVRKEKLGDRITALHQLVSPFGKTDTASVLLEAIGYIRFLQSQIEALSLPYLGIGSANMRNQHSPTVQGERNCLFPEDPGQLLNDSCMKRKGALDHQDTNEETKDLKSRGLCLVPLSCTLQVGSDNGADYWAPALGGGGFR